MGKSRKRSLQPKEVREAAGPGPEEQVRPRGTFPPEGPTRSWPRTAGSLAAVTGALIGVAWGLLCASSGTHYRSGLEADRNGKTLEAARELESAVAFYAPLNPFCRAAGERMLDLTRREAVRNPQLAEEVRERLRRSLRSTRWLVQPHADLLAAVDGGRTGPLPREPSAGLFLLSLVSLLTGLGAWWTPLPQRVRAVLGAGGLGGWALLLYLC